MLFCTAPLRYFALHCPHPGTPGSVLPLWGTVLCTAIFWGTVLCTTHGGHCIMRAPLVHCTLHCPPGALCSALQHPGALCSILPLGKWCSALTLCVTVLCTASFLGTVFMHCFSWALRSTLHSWGTVLCQLLLGTVPCTATWWYCALHCPSRAL